MAIRKIRNWWWIDIRHNHTRYRKRSPENSKAGAEAYEATIRQKLARGDSLALAPPDRKQEERRQKFKDFAWQWFDTYAKTNNKFSEVQRKRSALQRHLIPFFGQTPLDRVDTQLVEHYKSRKICERLANKTVNNHLTVLSSCLRTAQDWFDIPKMPKMKRLNTPPLQIDFLSQEESDLLLAHSSGLYRDIILMALKAGLRRGELIALSWSDINWSNKTLTVRHSWCEASQSVDTPKSNRERHIPLTDDLHAMLLRRKRAAGFVFVNEKGHRFQVKWFSHELRKACQRAGIQAITCHTLRHTFASHLAMAGASLKAIQELLGHANIEMTMRYAHLAPSSLRQTVKLLEPDERMFGDFGQPVGNAEYEPVRSFV